MRGDAGPHQRGVALEVEADEARVVEPADDRRAEGPQPEAVARQERGRRRPVLGRGAPVAGPEDDGDEPVHVVSAERGPAGEPDLDLAPGALVGPAQARRDGGRVVRDEEVARAEQLDELVAVVMLDLARLAHHQQSRRRMGDRRLAATIIPPAPA